MREKINYVFVKLNYLVLIGLIVAQSVVGANFYIGQFIYLGANALSLTRCFVLGRPIADKVKDCCMLGITCGLILIKFLGGIHS